MRHPDHREARFQPDEPSRRWSGAAGAVLEGMDISQGIMHPSKEG
jgi:hypothetical protein